MARRGGAPPRNYLQHEVEFRLRFLQVGDRLLARARLDELVEQPFALDPSFMPADDDAGCTRIGACLTAVAHHGFAQLVVGVLQIVDDDHGDIGEQGRADGLIECVLVAAGRIQVDALGVGPIVQRTADEIAPGSLIEICVTAEHDDERGLRACLVCHGLHLPIQLDKSRHALPSSMRREWLPP